LHGVLQSEEVLTERTTFSAELQAVMASRGATEWSKVLDVDRTTVHKWWSGDAFPRGRQLEAIARETGRTLRFVPHDETAAPPDWAERLLEGLFALEAKGGVSEEELAQAQARVAAYLAVARHRRRPPAGDAGEGAAGA
jgi:hypothetical protein